jgi:hypothetical protein
MKWFLITILSLSAFSEINAQCPLGEYQVVVYSCDFEFHRPKFDCKKGFWFCFTNCHWEKKCITKPASGFYNFVYAKIAEGEYLEFHFPNTVIEKQNFSKEEISLFNVDDPLVFEFDKQKLQLITGDYPTKQEKEELIVLVPFKSL